MHYRWSRSLDMSPFQGVLVPLCDLPLLCIIIISLIGKIGFERRRLFSYHQKYFWSQAEIPANILFIIKQEKAFVIYAVLALLSIID